MRRRRPSTASFALAIALAISACILQCVAGAGVFELQILEFSNLHGSLSSGACCGGGGGGTGGGGGCTAPCRTRFALCLKEYQTVAAPGACSFGHKSSPVLGTDSFTLADPLYTLALPFSFRWTRSFTLILQAFDDYNYPVPEGGAGAGAGAGEGSTEDGAGGAGLIEEAWWSGIVEPSTEWHALRYTGSHAHLAYRVRVLCQPNYYNTTCTTFCRPRDDKFGHYSCDNTGEKRCLSGWQGDNCEIPVCKEGCHPSHGRCDRPGDCDCRPGWRGELCSQCQPYPGCKHGYCNGSSWDCTCDTNWGGILCDQDLNYCGTHEPCQHGGTCENTAPDQYLCRCAEGFSGVDCERVDNPCAPAPCAHGVCSLAPQPRGFVCACERGWGGALCDIDIDECASSPCRHGALCRDQLDSFECECTLGWEGALCDRDVDECAAGSPCVNAAACNNTLGGYTCACLAGWTGRDCESNVDDCVGQCENGATCIDLVDDYHCACAGGYAGRTCSLDIDECAPRPCRNGGECVDLPNAYRCICPVGFSGTNCELSSCSGRYCSDDRDHCAGAPCGNGAACYTAQSDYYCHCSPGWTGKNCTQRAVVPAPAPAVGAVPAPGAGAYGAGSAGSAEPCVGGAPCVRGRCLRAGPAPAPAPRCSCDTGYGGALCNELVNECAAEPCQNNGTCVDGGRDTDFACVCRDGWTGKICNVRVEAIDRCPEGACENGGTCVREGGVWRCACAAGWAGPTCAAPAPCECAAGGTCVAVGVPPGWACACREGRTGARCDLTLDPCASAPCRNGGRCLAASAGEWWACECPAGWAGETCASRAPGGAACAPPCAPPALCEPDPARPDLPPRCVCPGAPPRAARRCLEVLAGLGSEGVDTGAEGEVEDEGGERTGGSGRGGACAGGNGTWWWGCNACRCVAGAALCTRLWCGVPDCLAGAGAGVGAVCRADEVCVPAAPALCVRPPCPPLGECRRVAGRSLEPPTLPAPPACWPGARDPLPAGCARAQLQLARERLEVGAHVERACSALRRALAASRAARAATAPPLALLCDIAPDDEDALDLALWIGEDIGGSRSRVSEELEGALREVGELVARRRLAGHALLGAAVRLRVPAAGAARVAPAAPLAPALLAGAACALLAGAAAVGALLVVRRRRAAAAAVERSRRCDEEKSNNLQNEENLRRYANPLRDDVGGVGGGGGAPGAGAVGGPAFYKAQNADARNDTPPRDKELTKRALPPPEPPPLAPVTPAGIRHLPHPPAERLTVLV